MARLPDTSIAPGNDQHPTQAVPEELRREIEKRVGPDLKRISPEAQSRILAQTIEVTTQFSGPIPPAFILQEYEQLLPGATDRIIRMAEEEQRHIHRLDLRTARYPLIAELCGKLVGALVTLAGIGASAWVIASGHPIAGSVMGGATIAVVALALIRHQRSEAEAKRPTQSSRKPGRR